MSNRISSTATSLVDLAIFSTICFGSLIFYGIKQLSTTSKQQSVELRIKDDRTKVIVISGCDRGLGHLMASEFSKVEGYLVVALTLTEQSAKDAFNSNNSIVAMKCDVTSDEDCQSMKEQVQSLLTERSAILYCIVNNAGIADPGDFVFHSGLAIPKMVMEVNFFGQLRVTQVLLPLMLSTSQVTGGKIINMSSVCGATASAGNSSYNASKFAVEAWSDSLKYELAPFGIQVVKIRPGQIQTDIQTDWLKNFAKNYTTASEQIRSLYGEEEYSKNVQDIVESMSNSNLSSPQLVADTVLGVLLQRGKLASYYWVGRDAKTFWKALTVLPAPLGDLIKSVIAFSPKGPKLPPNQTVAHLTICVRDIEKSLPFYIALGFETIGSRVGQQQFLQYNPTKQSTKWESLVLLKEDKNMSDRGHSSDAGYTRISIVCASIDSVVEELQSKYGISCMAPTAVDTKAGMKGVAYTDPDGFVICFLEAVGIIGRVALGMLGWWSKRSNPFVFSLTINVTDHNKIFPMFETLGFGTLFHQNKKQIANGMLPAFKLDPTTTVIESVRHCSSPNGGVVACIMDWTTPRTVVHSSSTTNSMTISVSDVESSLRKAKDLGMYVKDEKPEYRLLPIYGNVLVGRAFLEENSCPIDFCCFTNRRPY
jgi:NAD(P)-dependent dehydrogenase (short-subunit alcohol dehydrogenase family)/catechol 2,3-dioxygenase-like lactoylglutathione lyase family enzyme